MNFTQVTVIVTITAFLVQVIPTFFQKSLPKVGDVYTAPGWEKVGKVFRDHLDSGLEKGGAFAVFHKGELVVEGSGGYSDVEAELGWNKETITPLFSSVKGVTAITMALLVDRGLIEYDKPVAHYWPEFSQNGKENITIRQILSHQAGLPILDEPFHIQDIVDNPDKVARVLAEQKPLWEPGTDHGYHGITYGLYCDHIIRRVDPDHRDISQFFLDEIAKPFDLDLYIGLPHEENYRCARNYPPSFWDIIENREWTLLQVLLNTALGRNRFLELVTNPAGFMDMAINNPFVRAIPCGASRGFGTAISLAKLYGILANGGMYGHKMLLSPEVIQDMVKPQTSGPDRFMYITQPYASGVNILKSKVGSDMFGTGGTGGQMGFGDQEHHIGWSYVTNHWKMVTFYDTRSQPLRDAIYDTLDELQKLR